MESGGTTAQPSVSAAGEQQPLSPCAESALTNASALLDSIGMKEGYDQMVAERGLEAVEAEVSAVMTQISNSLASAPDSTWQLLQPFVNLVSLDYVPCASQKAIDTPGLLPALVQQLRDNSRPSIQQPAVSALTHIASDYYYGPSRPRFGLKYRRAVVDAGAIPPLVQLVSSPDDGVCAAAIETLVYLDRPLLGSVQGTISREGGFMMRRLGILKRLRKTMHERTNTRVLSAAKVLLRELCRSFHAPAFIAVGQFVPILANIIRTRTPDADDGLLHGAVSALAAICEPAMKREDSECRDAVVATGVCERLAELTAGEWTGQAGEWTGLNPAGIPESALIVLTEIALGQSP